jgi:hypothetical protein
MIFCKNKPEVCFYVLGQSNFHLRWYLSAPLPMAISHSKEMAVLQTTEMGNCNPGILVCFMWVTWRLPCFSRKSKFSYAVRKHLFRVCSVKAVLYILKSRLRLRMREGCWRSRSNLSDLRFFNFNNLRWLCLVVSNRLLSLLFKHSYVSIGSTRWIIIF